ncbi:menaquinone biosynthesis protein [Metallumcola ferriviriculae]|uniref:Chorismate dehydratase n=1 Tax=Metallumcola ferriviriculae TaxID=3039180 RepID=A0AAU0UQ04_9FIRM|nr:menaquinone biosynthesis protein [Desulfitibacteraceae bacterium MK1]
MTNRHNNLNVGVVDSLDYLPVIDAIESGEILTGVNLIKDSPKGLHDRFLDGELDIAPLPSNEYAEHFKQCLILPDLSMITRGDTSDLLLFSKVPVSQLDGKTICIPDTAVSSFVLLKILINHYYQMQVNYCHKQPDLNEMLDNADAALLFGEQAILARDEFNGHILDLGKLWRDFTAEPMVYALWVVREEYAKQNPVQVDFMAKALHACRNLSMKNIPRLVEKAKHRYNLSPDMVEGYFKSIKSSFDQSDRKALLRYFAHAQICGLIPPKVTLKVWGE